MSLASRMLTLSWVSLLGVPVRSAIAEELMSAEDLAARCIAADGEIISEDDLRIEGGTAEIGDCRVQLASFRLSISGVHFVASGFLMVDGQPLGEIELHDSVVSHSNPDAHILLRAHLNQIASTTLDLGGTISLETGAADYGELRLREVHLISRSSNIHIGSSGRGVGGRSSVERSHLSAATDVEILASAQALQGAGQAHLTTSEIFSRGTVVVQAGEEGRAEVRANRFIVAGAISLLAGGRIGVRRNDFLGGAEVLIEAPRCRAVDNFPQVSCSQEPAQE